MTDQITENAKAILLLCGRFSENEQGGASPLTVKEYDDVATWLQSKSWWPSDLLKEENREALNDAFAPVQPDRMKSLLARGAAMALAIEKWTNKGLWVLCRSDQDYPQRLKQHLKRNAPPILYGVGERELLSKGGLAVVGSRNVDADGQSFARDLGERAAESGLQLVSGAARGVDETAMHGAFSAGGSVVGVMADSLLRSAVSGKYREGIRDGQLVLVSTCNPEAGFNVGNAMGRNKYIYALADYAVVVSADHRQGGTWAGAEEELKRESGKPVFVRTGADVPKGNSELIKLGGLPFPDDGLKGNLKEALQNALAGTTTSVPAETESPATTVQSGSPKQPVGVRETPPTTEKKPAALPTSVYEAAKPLILKALEKPRTLDDLAKALQVRKPQLQDWVKLLITEGVLEQRTIRKIKKLAIRKTGEELKLS
jgi:predicted Rossmann fold nucleotide-binding protein DprA/Smf involved in DNA uptake